MENQAMKELHIYGVIISVNAFPQIPKNRILKTWIQIMPSPLISFVALGELVQFSH